MGKENSVGLMVDAIRAASRMINSMEKELLEIKKE